MDNQFMFNPDKVNQTIAQQVKYYDDFVKVKDSEQSGSDPQLMGTNPEELLALAQASDNPQAFLEDVALADLPQENVDDIQDQATLDSIMQTLSSNPDFDGNLEAVHGMVGELVSQVQGGLIDADSAQEQLVFNILDMFQGGQ